MIYSGYELLYLTLFYGFLGWVLETAVAATKQKKFVNRGLINGPVCVIYSVASFLMTVGLSELTGFWLLLGAGIYATVIEWIAGHWIERAYKERWWNYSSRKWNLDGYICLSMSVFWAILGFVIVRWGNPFLVQFYQLCPPLLIHLVLWIAVGILGLDALASYILARGKSGKLDKWEAANNQIAKVSARLGKWIAVRVDNRIHRAYPQAKSSTCDTAEPKDKAVFAKDCDFYKIVMLFFIGAFMGDITETIFCRITAGVWMSRSSVVWGPFSIVWGLAIAAVTAMLYKYRDRGDGFLFWIGTLLGGAYEYFCSVFTEIVFGKVFWDYSGMPFNLGGRINLLYCFFWGIAAVVWFKALYPPIAKWIEKIPVRAGTLMTWILIVFMAFNMVMSCGALVRYQQRGQGVEATEEWQQWMDEHYEDEVMERIYPNAKEA